MDDRTQERERFEMQIGWLRREPMPPRFQGVCPEVHSGLDHLRTWGRVNFQRVSRGQARVQPFEETDAIALLQEAACYPNRRHYPPELDRELDAVSVGEAKPPPQLTPPLEALLHELRQLAWHRRSAASLQRAWDVAMTDPAGDDAVNYVRLEAAKVVLLLMFGPLGGPPPEEA